MAFKQLKLNEDKTECLIVGKRRDLERLENLHNLRLSNTVVEVKNSVRDLGVTLDSNLSLKHQISKVVRVAGYHLRNIGFVRKYLYSSTTKMLIHNHIISRLDYCNSIYYGLPNYLLKKLQIIMNRAARLVGLQGVSPRERITPVLRELHWLPIKARVIYKICLLTYQAVKFEKPLYLREVLRNFQPDTSIDWGIVQTHTDWKNQGVTFNWAFGHSKTLPQDSLIDCLLTSKIAPI